MPDPLLYLKSMLAAAAVSAIVVIALPGARRTDSRTRLNSACVLGLSLGIAAGIYAMSLRLAWPPANGLDRLLTVVVPSVLCIEFVAGFPRMPPAAAWFLRICLAALIPRILFHDSIYLSGSDNSWPLWQAVAVQVTCGVLLAGTWGLLFRLSQRSGPAISVSLALVLSTICAGLCVMLAGYLKGGAVAFPLATALFATAIASRLFTKQFAPAILGIGLVNLFGVLFIGRFFGRLSTESALTILLAPLLCWVTELPALRTRAAWQVGSIQLLLVAIVLLLVLALAKQDFDRKMGPLLGMLSQ